MAVTTVSVQYSIVNFNRILQSQQQIPISEERNVNNVISTTDNQATTTIFVRTKTVHEDEADVG